MRFELAEGMQVVAHGRLDVYPPRGSYSLNVQRLEPSGVGLLLAQFEALKAELKRRGWFDRKRPLPRLPRTIGVVTSRDGAALRDFLRTRSLRWPLYPVRLAHAPVQGPGAAVEIARAIERLDRSGVDVIAVIRGGGSLEDLWAFNELAGGGRDPRRQRAGRVRRRARERHDAGRPGRRPARAHAHRRGADPLPGARGAWPASWSGSRAGCSRRSTARCARASGVWRELAGTRVLRDARWIAVERERRLGELVRRAGSLLGERLARSETHASRLHRRLERRSPQVELELAHAAPGARRRDRRARPPAGCSSGASARASSRPPSCTPSRRWRSSRAATRSRRAQGDGAPLVDPAALAPGEAIATRLAGGRVIRRVTGVDATAPPAARS